MKKTLQRNDGFTLIEIIVVMIILGIMAMLVVPNFLSYPDKARVTAAQSDIKAISNALELYKLEHHVYPTTSEGLAALVNDGAYLKKLPIDPWGKPYQYICPGTHGAYDLFSYGADGVEGGEGVNADITSWDL